MLTDIIKLRVVELGKIKVGCLGEERQKTGGSGTYRLPKKLDHFIITTLNRDAAGGLIVDKRLMDQLKESGYADEDGYVRRIPIQVMSNDIEDIMQSSYCIYSGKRLAAHSDGKILTLYADLDKNKWLDEPTTTEWNDDWKNRVNGKGDPIFKVDTVFSCVIAMEQAKFGGVYKFRTTSRISSENLLSGLTAAKMLSHGVLRGLPMELNVYGVFVKPKGVVSKVHVVNISVIGGDLAAIARMGKEIANEELKYSDDIKRLQLEYKKILKAPGVQESRIEQAEAQQEFYPEVEDEGIPPGVDPLAALLGISDEPVIDVESIPETTVDNAESFEPITPAQVSYLVGVLGKKTGAFLKVMSERWTISAFEKIPVSLYEEIKKAAFDYSKS